MKEESEEKQVEKIEKKEKKARKKEKRKYGANKIFTRIIASILAILMLVSVAGTLIYSLF